MTNYIGKRINGSEVVAVIEGPDCRRMMEIIRQLEIEPFQSAKVEQWELMVKAKPDIDDMLRYRFVFVNGRVCLLNDGPFWDAEVEPEVEQPPQRKRRFFKRRR